MPQLQALSAIPSLGERLGEALGVGAQEGLSSLLGQYQERKKREGLAAQFEKAGINPAFASLDPQIVKQLMKQEEDRKFLESIFPSMAQRTDSQQNLQQMLGNEQSQQMQQQSSISTQPEQNLPLENITPEQRLALSIKKPQVARVAQEEEKLKTKQQELKEKAFERSYALHKDFIDKTTNQFKAFETETKPKLLQMQALKDDELIGPTAAKFLETIGIPLGALENPSSELYQKLSQDLLKGLPETYGSRILQVEVDNFLKTIPTLMNSADGRRMIASNMLKLGEMKRVYYDEMRRQQMNYIDKAEKLPLDFEQRILDNVMPQINKINEEFVKMASIKSVPPNTVPFFNPQGEISFVPKTAEALDWATKNGGKRIW